MPFFFYNFALATTCDIARHCGKNTFFKRLKITEKW